MSEETIHNPHDQLFKEVFSRRESAVDFFQNYLPAEIRLRLSWDTMQLQPGSYTDEAFRGSESDLLYSVQIEQTSIFLYCLFEHQSTPDAWMPLRLLRYILAIWDQHRKQNPSVQKLPPVLPLVLYQGGSKWVADLSLSGLIEIPAGLELYQPDFRHLLVDLTNIGGEALRGSLIVKAVLLELKASRQGLHHELPRIFNLLADVLEQDASPGIIRTLLRYICTVDNDTDLAEYIKQVEAVRLPKLKEEAMTIAEQLRNEGKKTWMQQGLQQGMQQEAGKTLMRIMRKRFGEVSPAIEKKVADASVEQVEDWIDATLDAADIADVFAD